MFALFLSGDGIIEHIGRKALGKLLMNPVDEMAVVGVLDSMTGFTDGHMAVLLKSKSGALLIEKNVSNDHQRPKPKN